MTYYLIISALFFIFYYFYLGFYHRNRGKTYQVMRQRIETFAGGKFKYYTVDDEVLYHRLSYTIILSSLFWPVEVIYYLYLKFVKSWE